MKIIKMFAHYQLISIVSILVLILSGCGPKITITLGSDEFQVKKLTQVSEMPLENNTTRTAPAGTVFLQLTLVSDEKACYQKYIQQGLVLVTEGGNRYRTEGIQEDIDVDTIEAGHWLCNSSSLYYGPVDASVKTYFLELPNSSQQYELKAR
jgi:hypothetical protein